MSKRQYDINGWFEVKDNPLSKVGVFPYSGAMIDPNGEFGLDPDKTYLVMRPEEELSDSECIDSFKLLPWIDDHEMLGGDGLTPPEEKGVEGVIGENVYFDKKDKTLKANIKVFAESLKDEIDKGKRELSAGYRCTYEKESGAFNGQKYNFVQRCIRGNHLASVDNGRMGPEVAVLDSNLLTFTIDSKELTMTLEEMQKILEGLVETVSTLSEKVEALITSAKDSDGKGKDTDPDSDGKDKDPDPDDEGKDMDPDDEGKDADPDGEGKDKDPDPDDKDKDSKGMDSLIKGNKKLVSVVDGLKKTVKDLKENGAKFFMSEISERDKLAEKLSSHIGTFDHANMTLKEVAVYGTDKLELTCDKGQELATVKGYLHGRTPSTDAHGFDSSSSGGNDEIDNYVKGEDK